MGCTEHVNVNIVFQTAGLLKATEVGNLTARPVSNVQCAHDAPFKVTVTPISLKNGWRDHCRTTRRPHLWCERKGIDSSSNLTNAWEEWKQKLYWKERCLNSFNIKKRIFFFFFETTCRDDVFGMSFPWKTLSPTARNLVFEGSWRPRLNIHRGLEKSPCEMWR